VRQNGAELAGLRAGAQSLPNAINCTAAMAELDRPVGAAKEPYGSKRRRAMARPTNADTTLLVRASTLPCNNGLRENCTVSWSLLQRQFAAD
jgi:hypothetical protein